MSQLAMHGGPPLRQKPFARWPQFDETELAALNEVLQSGVWGGYHPKVAEFEQAFAHWHDARFGVSAANGTVTLETALRACGIGAGDEIIVPPFTFIATATAVSLVGATPVFVDIDATTFNLDLNCARAAVTPRTRAIIPVHFAGHPLDMDALMDFAAQHQLIVIEDCAHAHGAAWRGRKVGSFGAFGSFSFQASKVLTAGEGGLLTTNDDGLAERARSIINQGRRTSGAWYEHFELGTNYRLTGWQAAILQTQFARLPAQLERRAANAAYLINELAQLDLLIPPAVDEAVTCHSWYLFILRLNRERYPQLNKPSVVQALAAEGMPVNAGYPYPLYRNEVFASVPHRVTPCPITEKICEEAFWISHEILLVEPEDVVDFVRAVAKVQENVDALATKLVQ
ncbi:MAG: DegT/DnrJ/EryC1/StrS family aminotransferase [Acidobacteria bacterium]|nr:DegT/DnrJ/EryC1/StrS family aminotransferase [Acidobacteriota bacterium]